MSLSKILGIFITLLIAAWILTTATILAVGFIDNIHKTDVAVILGAKVTRHGTPTPRLAARLDTGIALYHQHYFSKIIVTGGTEGNGFNEARVMKNYLIAHHVPASAIIEEPLARNTWENAEYAKKIIDQNNFKTVMIITQYFHMARAWVAFYRCGITPSAHAHASFFEKRDWYAFSREIPGLYDYVFFRSLPNTDFKHPEGQQ